MPPTSGGWSHVAVDMAGGSLDADGQTSTFSGVLTTSQGYDRHTTQQAGSWDVTGTDGNDLVRVNDYVQTSGPVAERGLGGDDQLFSGPADDTLDGGTGTDQGSAGAGTDTCSSIESGVAGAPTGCETSTP